MSEQPVTIREHIHQALVAAGPVGLTMSALVSAVAEPWSPREAQDAVRRLWQVGELGRRQDGTFVLSERTANETRDSDRELDEAIRRVAERARRASHHTEVRVRKVDPALPRGFCPTCRTQVTPRLDGRCHACGTQTGANLEAPAVSGRAAAEAAAQGAGRLGSGVSALRRTEGAPGPHLPRVSQWPARRLQPQPDRWRSAGSHRRGAVGRGAAAVRKRAQPAGGGGRASPPHRLQDGRLVRGGAARALQPPGLEPPATA